MNQEQRAKWGRTRAKGMWRFVLLYGVLTSVSMIVAVTIFDYFTSPGGVTLDRLKIRVPIFLVSGFVAGLVIWFIGEYRYRQGRGSGS